MATVLRWIAVPFSWVGAFAVGNLAAHLFNFDLLLYAVGPYFGVFMGSITAPAGQKPTSVVLCTLTALLLILSAVGFFMGGKIIKGILALVGVAAAVFASFHIHEGER